MSDSTNLHVQPVSAVMPTERVRSDAVKSGTAPVSPGRPAHAQPAASTGGSLPAAYAQISVDPDSNEMVIRVRDAGTGRVLNEFPSAEIQHLAKYLKDYADALARHHASAQASAAS